MPELQRFAPNVPVVLLGTKTDLRDSSAKEHITKKEVCIWLSHETFNKLLFQGEKMAKEIGAKLHAECSSKNVASISEVVRKTIQVCYCWNISLNERYISTDSD